MYNIDFFNKLSGFEQEEVLRFARAYMRVRELHNDKSLHKVIRKRYKELEAKLEVQVTQSEEE